MPDRPTILTVHAHPDDEASKGASTLAKYHAAGAYTVLVCCTGGEEGDLHNPSLREEGQPFHGLSDEETRAKMAELRPLELAASAAVIGFDEVVMLGYRDSGMPDSLANADDRSFWKADLDEAAGRLVAVIRRTRPQVVMTYSDDQQWYPHPDHLRVHDISVLAFERAGDPAWYPEAGEPFQPSKLYYSHWSMARMKAVNEALKAKLGESPFERLREETDGDSEEEAAVSAAADHEAEPASDVGSDGDGDGERDEDDRPRSWLDRPDTDDRITTRIDVGEFMWARSGALRAHATQVDPAEVFWFGLTDDELAEVWPYEEWILARSTVGEIGTEDDLFAGISGLERVA